MHAETSNQIHATNVVETRQASLSAERTPPPEEMLANTASHGRRKSVSPTERMLPPGELPHDQSREAKPQDGAFEPTVTAIKTSTAPAKPQS